MDEGYRKPPPCERLITLEVAFSNFRAYVKEKFVDQAQHLSDLNHVKTEAAKMANLDRELFVRQDVYKERHAGLETRMNVDSERIAALEKWQAWTIGIGSALILVSGAVGWVVGRFK